MQTKDINLKATAKKYAPAAVALGLMAFFAGSAMAGAATDQSFNEVWDTLVDWTQGTLGRIIAITTIVVGLVMGVVRQSIMGAVIGIASGMVLYNSSTVIEGIVGATVVPATQGTFVSMLSNGLF